MKFCNHCKTLKHNDEFYRRSDGSGVQSTCKRCVGEISVARRKVPAIRKREYELARAYRRNNLQHMRNLDRERNLRKLGIEKEQYDKLFTLQNGVCAICKKPETAILKGKVKNLAVDHCHDSSKVRGLLCSKCNTAIGLLNHDVDLLELAQVYLLYDPDALAQLGSIKHGQA